MESLNFNSQDRELHQLKQMQDNAKESCMVSFQLLHSHLKDLSHNNLKGTCIGGGFEQAFSALFDQDVQTFTGSRLLNLDQLEKQLNKEEFQETGSMDAFRKSINERAQHKREYDSRVNERQMQSKEGKVDSSKALDASLAVTECSGTKSDKQDTSSRSGNDTHVEDVDIKLVNDKDPMAKVQLTAQHNVLANEQQHSVQSEPIYDTHLLKKVDRNTTPDSTNMCHKGGQIDQNAEKCQVSCPLLDPSFDNMTTEFSNQSFESGNISLKKTVTQLKKDFSRMEAHSKIKKEIKVLETINIELEHSVAKLLAENEKFHKENEHLKQTYKDLYDSIKKTRVQTKDHNDSLIAQINSKTIENTDLKAQIQEQFTSQVDVNNVLSKPISPHYFSKVKESLLAKPHHVIAPDSSRNSQEESYGSNDTAHNHYLEEARKKTQERNRNLKSSVMHTTSLQNTTNGSKQKRRSNNQTSRSFPVSKSSGVTSKSVPLVDHSRNSSSFSDSKHFTRDITKPVEPTSHTQKPSRQIVTRHRFSPNKSSDVHEKTNTPRSCLRWIPTGRIFNIAGLRWVPTGKIFTSSITKVDCEPPNGSNKDITNPYECDQTLNVSTGAYKVLLIMRPFREDECHNRREN
ncbi:hypothetical protein Tco_1316799 [Tanacetum coccineum]